MFQKETCFIDMEKNAKMLGIEHSQDGNSNKPNTTCFLIDNYGHFFCHIPQDFNLDIETAGSITGHNEGDSKLLASNVSLHTTGEEATIEARRVRSDLASLKSVNGNIQINSYVETQNLELSTAGDVEIRKRLGIAKRGEVNMAGGKLKIGSVFACMAKLPHTVWDKFSDLEE